MKVEERYGKGTDGVINYVRRMYDIEFNGRIRMYGKGTDRASCLVGIFACGWSRHTDLQKDPYVCMYLLCLNESI